MRRRRHGCKKLGKCCLYILGRNIVAWSQLLRLLEYVASKENPVLHIFKLWSGEDRF